MLHGKLETGYLTRNTLGDNASGTARLSHFDTDGSARMVDVTSKSESDRRAVARGRVVVQPSTLLMVRDQLSGVANEFQKGDVLSVARLAGIMAAKRTAELIPLCHPLPISGVQVSLYPEGADSIVIEASVRTVGRTGVEMEALTAVSVAALTVYDMCKSIDRGMRIVDVHLVEKHGGSSGDFQAAQPEV